MQLLMLYAFVFTCLGTAILGARLVMAGVRTRTAPELCYGLGLLLSGTSAALRVVVFGILGPDPEQRIWVTIAVLCSAGSLAAIATGVRVIFRPAEGWARAALAVFGCAALGGIAFTVLGDLDPNRPLRYRPLELGTLLSAIWGSIECWLYHAKMKKRLALGLADPLTTNQFAVWGTGFSLAALASALYLFGPLATGTLFLDAPILVLAVQALMVGMTLGTWMAFYPPAAYRRYILRNVS